MPPGGAPPAGVQLSGVPYDTGSVYLDGIDVRGFVQRGIYVRSADSVVIQHATIQGDTAYPGYGYCSSSPGVLGGIVVDEASYSRVASSTVTDSWCASIAVFQTAGQAVVSGNRVARVGGVGILVSAPQVALDHNAVRDVRSINWDGTTSAGIRVSNWNRVLDLTSLADTVRHVGGSGFLVDTLLTAMVDSLVVDSAGVDSVGYAYGAALYAGRYTVQHSRISNTLSNGLTVCGSTAALFSRGNRYTRPGFNGISSWDCHHSGTGPDTLVSVADTVVNAFENTATGIRAADTRYARIDSAVVSGSGTDSAMGIGFNTVRLSVLRDSRVRNVGSDGVYVYYGAGARLERDSLTAVGGSGVYVYHSDSVVLRDARIVNPGHSGVEAYGGTGALVERSTIASSGWEGLYFEGPSDTTRVRQTLVTNSASSGIRVVYGAVVRADTIAATGSANGSSGMSFDHNGGGRVTGSRLEGNSHYGVHVHGSNYPGVITLDSLNSLAGNTLGGVVNDQPESMLYAERNWWGRVTGPDQVEVAVDSSSVVGTVDFTNFLTSRPTFPLAPQVQRDRAALSASLPGASPRTSADRSAGQERRGRGARDVGASPAVVPAGRSPAATPPVPTPTRTPMVTYRKGASPRPATVHHPQ
jgi:hypothetical protein